MKLTFAFFFNNLLLGVGLAMDAFSVSLANGLNEPQMKRGRMIKVAGVFSVFQFAMPMIGWICVSSIVQYFRVFEKFIPWIALGLLGYIGGEMLYSGIRNREPADEAAAGLSALLVQGVATSIDALSVGFTIADYRLPEAFLASLLIGIVTFLICFAGLEIGKRAGTKLAGKAGILGGIILLVIGVEIFVSGMTGH